MRRISLKAARVNAGITQKEAAKAFNISVTTMIRWERSPWEIPFGRFAEIEELYGIPADMIFFTKPLESNSISSRA